MVVEVKEELMVDIKEEPVRVPVREVPSDSSVSDSCGGTTVPGKPSLKRRRSGPTRTSTKGGWTEKEDMILTEAVQENKGKNWKKIAGLFPNRKDVQCLHRWQKVLNPDLVKGPWAKEEDNLIRELVAKHGRKKWALIAKSLPGRVGKQCRERWHNHLNPAIKRDAWTEEEEAIIADKHKQCGNKWAVIARYLNGRSDNAIKNHWNCSLKKRLDSNGNVLRSRGITGTDPFRGERKPERIALKVETQSPSKPVPTDKKIGLKDGIDTCSTDLILGIPNRPETQSEPGPVMMGTDGSSVASSDIRSDLGSSTIENIVSPHIKRPEDHISYAKDLRLNDFSDYSFLSLSTFGGTEANGQGQVCEKNEAHGLCYAPPQLSDVVCTASNPSRLFTPSRAVSVGSCSPESILRESARSFRGMPNIIRKRTSKLPRKVIHRDSTPMDSLKILSSAEPRGFKSTDCTNTKQSFLSSLRTHESSVGSKYQRVLEHAFDMECDPDTSVPKHDFK